MRSGRHTSLNVDASERLLEARGCGNMWPIIRSSIGIRSSAISTFTLIRNKGPRGCGRALFGSDSGVCTFGSRLTQTPSMPRDGDMRCVRSGAVDGGPGSAVGYRGGFQLRQFSQLSTRAGRSCSVARSSSTSGTSGIGTCTMPFCRLPDAFS